MMILIKYSYSKYGTEFDTHSAFSLSSANRFSENAIIFRVDNSSSVHASNKNNICQFLIKVQKMD